MTKRQLILIADDTAVNRSLLSDILSADYDVAEAQDGLEAVAVLSKEKDNVALLLLDVLMPNMDGFEVLSWMHQNHYNERIPVVIISSETSPAYIGKGLEYGVSDYIIRPFIPELVLHRVRNTILLHASGQYRPRTLSTIDAAQVLSGQSALSQQTLLQLKREQIKFDFLSSISKEVVLDYDTETDDMAFSTRCQEEFGVPDIIHNFQSDYCPKWGYNGKLFQQLLKKASTTTPLQPDLADHLLLKNAGGTRQWYAVSIRALWIQEETGATLYGVVGKLENVHETILEKNLLREKARHEPLTGLYNSRAAKELITAALASKQKHDPSLAALMLIDLDFFKAANDSFGHQFGDTILLQVSHAIRSNTRRSDIGARVGGDEFLIYLDSIRSPKDVERHCSRIFSRLKPLGGKFDYTLCMGVAICPQHGTTYDTLFQKADAALYYSKRTGRNRFTIYRDDLNDAAAGGGFAGDQEQASLKAAPHATSSTGGAAYPASVHALSAAPISEYDLLVSMLNVGISKHLLDDHFTMFWANDRYYEILGYSQEEYQSLFHNRTDLYFRSHPDGQSDLTAQIASALREGDGTCEFVCRMHHQNGNRLWVRLAATALNETMHGKNLCYMVMYDVTEQMQAQVEQTVTSNLFPGLIAKFCAKADGLYFIDASNRYFDVFDKVDRLLLNEMAEDTGLASLAMRYGEVRSGKPISFSITKTDRHGKRLHMNAIAECIDWIGEDPVYLIMYADVTPLMEQNAELQRLAYVDPITEGMNRTRFDMVAGATVHATTPGSHALVWLNLQKFKLINDLFGKTEGNRLLKYIHDVLKQHLRPEELVARTASDNLAC